MVFEENEGIYVNLTASSSSIMARNPILRVTTLLFIFLLSLHLSSSASVWKRVVNTGNEEPMARFGHTTLYVKEHDAMYIFGGHDKTNVSLNDLWRFRFEKGAGQVLRGRWELLSEHQSFAEWFSDSFKPAGRFGHSSVVHENVAIFMGGSSPNCSDYCVDLWKLDLSKPALRSAWTRLYDEFWGIERKWLKLFDYAKFKEKRPGRRWGHAAVMRDGTDEMYLFGGHGGPRFSDELNPAAVWFSDDRRPSQADPFVQFLNDLWWTRAATYVPFEENLVHQEGVSAIQSSTAGSGREGTATTEEGVARLAIDGSYNGYYRNGSVTLTNEESQPWWQADLGDLNFIDNVTIFNREDCCMERLSNFYLFVSRSPMPSTRLQDLLRDPLVWKHHVMYLMENHIAIPVKQFGQYVRIQLVGSTALSLTEVEVWGYAPIEKGLDYCGMRRWVQYEPGVGPFPASDQPLPRREHAATTYNDKMYVFGGRSVRMPAADLSIPFYLNDLWTFDFTEKTWLEVVSLVQDPFTNVRTGEPTYLGGIGEWENNVCQRRCRGETNLGRPRKGEKPIGRYGHQMFQTEGILFVTGGRTSPYGDHGIWVPDASGNLVYEGDLGHMIDVWQFNVSSGVWTEADVTSSAEDPPAGRFDHTTIFRGTKAMPGVETVADIGHNSEGGVCGDMWSVDVLGPNSCPEDCFGHGVCDSGFCICNDGFTGTDCSSISCPNDQCRYDYTHHTQICLQCNGNGVCDGRNGSCSCDAGWVGEDCGIIYCPNNCSYHGVCKVGGICECDDRFRGLDCAIVDCPNNEELAPGRNCSGRGDCVVQRNSTNPSSKDYYAVTATCICGDTFSGADCSQELADYIVLQRRKQISAGYNMTAASAVRIASPRLRFSLCFSAIGLVLLEYMYFGASKTYYRR